jgi:hypothetical protein
MYSAFRDACIHSVTRVWWNGFCLARFIFITIVGTFLFINSFCQRKDLTCFRISRYINKTVHLAVSRKRLTRRDTVSLFGTRQSENVSVTHSRKLSKSETPGNVQQRTLVALVKKTSVHLDYSMTAELTGTSSLQHDVAFVSSCTTTVILCVC